MPKFTTIDPSDVQQIPIPEDYAVTIRPDGVLVVPGGVTIRHFRKRFAVVQYDQEANILGILPCEGARKAATRTTGKHHPQGETRISIGKHLNMIGFEGTGRFLSEWVSRPGRLDIYLNREIVAVDEAVADAS